MDLKALIAQSKSSKPYTPPTEISSDGRERIWKPIPQAIPSDTLCICGHPEDAHDGECTILECECGMFAQATAAKPSAAKLPPRTANIEQEIAEAKRRAEASSSRAALSRDENTPTLGETLEKVEQTLAKEIPSKSSADIEEVGINNCHHICQPSIPNSKGPQGCGLWWTHGLKQKCRHPEILNLGLCPTCLGAHEKPFNPLEDFDGEKLTPAGIMRAQNKARHDCKDMNSEQLTHHIMFLAKQIEMLKAEAMGTKKLRTELEEEQLLNVPPEEREKFIQALRRSKDAKTKATKAKVRGKVDEDVEKGVRLGKRERYILNMMKTTGKSRATIERYLDE